MPNPAHALPAAGLPCLVVRSGRGEPCAVALTGAALIGRAAGCGVRVADPTVSAFHCLLYPASPPSSRPTPAFGHPFYEEGTHQGGGEWWVADLGSRNGTWLAGRRVEAPVRLREGDCIRLGRTNSLLVFLEPAPDTAAAAGAAP